MRRRGFLRLMREVRLIHRGNGAFSWWLGRSEIVKSEGTWCLATISLSPPGQKPFSHQSVSELSWRLYFLAVAEEMNFTRAARKVGIGQPPLSQQIRSLEEELGAPLFGRVPLGVELTDSGKVFLPEAEAILAQAERAKKIARRGARGELGSLRLGFTSSAAFARIVKDAIRIFRENWCPVPYSSLPYPGRQLSIDASIDVKKILSLSGRCARLVLFVPCVGAEITL